MFCLVLLVHLASQLAATTVPDTTQMEDPASQFGRIPRQPGCFCLRSSLHNHLCRDDFGEFRQICSVTLYLDLVVSTVLTWELLIGCRHSGNRAQYWLDCENRYDSVALPKQIQDSPAFLLSARLICVSSSPFSYTLSVGGKRFPCDSVATGSHSERLFIHLH